MARRFNYRRMTPAQLSAALDQLGLTMRQLCRLAGSDPSRAERWLTGAEEIPPHIPLLCVLLTLPGAMELARTYTDSVISEKEPPS